MKTLSKLGRILAVPLAIGLAGVGCGLNESGPTKPITEEQYRKELYPKMNFPRDQEGFIGVNDGFLIDVDKDGKIDVIGYRDIASFVAKGYEGRTKEARFIFREGYTEVMTPEMVEYASQIAEAQRNFGREYLKNKGLYIEQKAEEVK